MPSLRFSRCALVWCAQYTFFVQGAGGYSAHFAPRVWCGLQRVNLCPPRPCGNSITVCVFRRRRALILQRKGTSQPPRGRCCLCPPMPLLCTFQRIALRTMPTNFCPPCVRFCIVYLCTLRSLQTASPEGSCMLFSIL